MDEYFFSFSQQGDQRDCNQYIIDDQIIERRVQQQADQLKQNQQFKQKQQEFPTNATARLANSFNNQSQLLQIQIEQKLPPEAKIRQENRIQYSSKIQIQSIFTFSGSKNDTVQLNTNFKTLFSCFLLKDFDSLQQDQKIIVNQFQQDVASFKSLKKIFRASTNINSKCQRIICSSVIIKKIFQNRAKFGMKIQMIKYLEALNKNLKSENVIRWKSIRKS